MNSSIISISDIPLGTCSLTAVGEINILRLFDTSTPDTYFHVELNDGHLCIVEKEVGRNWARFITVARNCHEQNVELTKSHDGLMLRSTRHIKCSEELFVWLGYDLLIEFEFPYLKPNNIKGNQDYICHECGHVFQNPNPLKVHLLLQCKSSRTFPFIEISNNGKTKENYHFSFLNSLKSVTEISNFNERTFPRKIFPKDLLKRDSFQTSLTNKSKLFHTVQDFKCVKDDTIKQYNVIARCRISENYQPSTSNIWTSSSDNNCSSAGHICPYCGKIYSRKYGLKIHVRTHTGYKPLKCKYCLRLFSDPSNLNKHVRLHSDSPYQCLICGKLLIRRRDLQRHIKSRHQEVAEDDSKN